MLRRSLPCLAMRRFCSTVAPNLPSAAFRYQLPPELIAQEAAEPRDAAKLLVALPGSDPFDATFSQLPALLPPNAHLVHEMLDDDATVGQI